MGGKQERQMDNNTISFSREVRENRKEGKKGSSIYKGATQKPALRRNPERKGRCHLKFASEAKPPRQKLCVVPDTF